jgi:hypothetical protein
MAGDDVMSPKARFGMKKQQGEAGDFALRNLEEGEQRVVLGDGDGESIPPLRNALTGSG